MPAEVKTIIKEWCCPLLILAGLKVKFETEKHRQNLVVVSPAWDHLVTYCRERSIPLKFVFCGSEVRNIFELKLRFVTEKRVYLHDELDPARRYTLTFAETAQANENYLFASAVVW